MSDPGPVGDRAPGRVDRTSGRRTGRRVDPTGKHALFTTPVRAAPDQLGPGNRSDGRGALYSTGPRQPGTVVVECATCRSRSRVSLVDLGVRFLSVSAWVPLRRHPHWLRCPACGQHTWCRISWSS